MVVVLRKSEGMAASTKELFPGEVQMERLPYHQPVMVAESVSNLAVREGGVYVDCTVGEGGHAAGILEQATPSGKLLGLDFDPGALDLASYRLTQYGAAVTLVQGSYAHLMELATSVGISQADGVFMDLGLSSYQLEASGRGFSFQRDEPLDMRYDPQATLTAATVVNTYPLEMLASLIRHYGEEPRARAIARAIGARRPLRNTKELATLMAEVKGRRRGINPATRTFQALRIEVNRELENLQDGLRQALDLLRPGGRLVVISYHSLEDRIVKNTFATEARGCICPPHLPVCVCDHIAQIRLISRRVIRPTSQEISTNSRSRSARMRVVERLH